MKAWHVYLIECVGGSIYCGIAIDVDKRYALHAAGKGARYTRSWPPLKLLMRLRCGDKSTALRAELAIKRLDAQRKRELAGMSTARARRALAVGAASAASS